MRTHMKSLSRTFLIFGLFALTTSARAQVGAGGFQVTKINKNMISAPAIAYVGGEQITQNQRDLWLAAEAEFTSTAEVADDVTFRYFILVAGKVLTGEVTHMNLMAGRGLRSVMFASPKVLLRANGGRPVTTGSIANITVQIVQGGGVKDEANLVRAPAQWYNGLPQLAGLLLNKNDTPFGPLYWDHYEQIKPR